MLNNSGNHRAQKVASMIRAEVARLLISEVSDPRLSHLVITDVEVSKDLRTARVYYESGPSSDQKEIERGLSRAVAFFRRKLGSNLEMRYVPQLVFQVDTHSNRLNQLLTTMDGVRGTKE